MIVSLGSAGHISGREYRPDTHLSQTLGRKSDDNRYYKIYEKSLKIFLPATGSWHSGFHQWPNVGQLVQGGVGQKGTAVR